LATSAQPDDSAGLVAPLPRRRNIALAIITEPGLWLALYVVGLALVAFWPVRIDRDADALYAAITAAVPWLTEARVEFAANIALFVPFGLLLVATLRRRGTLALVLAIVVSTVMEAGQGLFLVERTPSVFDILANTTGAAVGIIIGLDLLRPPRSRR
jgi:cytochrome c biogenesis factor